MHLVLLSVSSLFSRFNNDFHLTVDIFFLFLWRSCAIMSTVAPRWVIVDDVDSQIQYTGPWFADQGSRDSVGNFGPPYQSTMHGTTSNASLSFAFNGTQIKVIGSNNIRNDSGVLDPTWECFVDNISIGASSPFAFAENNWGFCEQDTLVDGPHILTVNATVLKNQTFWIDNIQYVSSASVSLDQKTIVVDNLDPQLQYGQGWQALGGTANMTTVSGSIFLYDFIGVSLSWYGFIPVELPKGSSAATYSIDGETPVNFLLKGLSTTTTTTVYNQKFFETAQLAAGPHTLKAVFEGNNSTPLTLDYLIVQNGTLSSTTTSTSSTSISSHATSSTSSSVVSGTSVTERSSRTAVRAVVGGVIGGLALIVLVIFGFLFLYRRRKRATQEQILISTPEPFGSTPIYSSSITQAPSPSVVTSFSPSLQTTQMGVPVTKGHAYHASIRSLTSTNPRPVPFQQTTLTTAGSPNFPPSEPSLPPSRKSEALASAPVQSSLVLHADSGIRMPSSTAGTSVVDVPPLYTRD